MGYWHSEPAPENRVRRDNKSRSSARVWLRVFGALILVGLLVAMVLGLYLGREWAKREPFFNFASVRIVTPNALVPTNRVQAAVQSSLDGNYLFANLDRVRDSVEAVPWVKRAEVRRLWPNTLEVSFEPYRALALYEDGRLVSKEGVLFSADPAERGPNAPFLPRFYGAADQIAKVTEYYERFQATLAPLKVQVTDINYSDRGSWSLVMSGPDIPPTKVELGQERTGESVNDRLADVVASYNKVRAMLYGSPGRIDARYVQAFAVTLPNLKAVEAWKKRGATSSDSAAPHPSSSPNAKP